MSVEVRDEDRQALNLHDNPDAQAWAKEFCKMYSVYTEDGVVQDKEGLMIAWFANAMMAMHDTCHRAQSPPASAVGLEEAIEQDARFRWFVETYGLSVAAMADLANLVRDLCQPVGVVTAEDIYLLRVDLVNDHTDDDIADWLNGRIATRPRADGGDGGRVTSVQQGLIDSAVAYVDQLSSFNRLDHPEVQNRRMCLAEMVNAYHNEQLFADMSGDSETGKEAAI